MTDSPPPPDQFQEILPKPKIEKQLGSVFFNFYVGRPETLTEWKSESITDQRTDGHLTWVGARDTCVSKKRISIFLKIKRTNYYQEPTQHQGESCLGEIWSKAGEMIEARQFHALVEVQLAQVGHLCAMNIMYV